MKIELLEYNNSNKIKEICKNNDIKNDEIMKHISFVFSVEGISRSCSHQLVRHRVAAFSQQSQRYIKIKKLNDHVIIPPNIRENDLLTFKKLIDEIKNSYEKMLLHNIPKEDARFILPNAAETNLLVTMNGYALKHFFGLRCCNRAQWEIKEVAEFMLDLVKKVEPDLFKKIGPYCVQYGTCPEGSFTCGKMAEVIKKYSYI